MHGVRLAVVEQRIRRQFVQALISRPLFDSSDQRARHTLAAVFRHDIDAFDKGDRRGLAAIDVIAPQRWPRQNRSRHRASRASNTSRSDRFSIPGASRAMISGSSSGQSAMRMSTHRLSIFALHRSICIGAASCRFLP